MDYRALTLGAALGFVLALSHSCGGGDRCDANSCPTGCCNSDGTCVTATTASQCGTSGQSCGTCATGQSCVAGLCTGSSGGGGGDAGCASTNPNGCCTPNGVALPGDSTTSCGSGGIPCADCTRWGYECLDPDGPTGSEMRACRPTGGGAAVGLIGSACTSPTDCASVPVNNPATRMCKTQSTFGNFTYQDGYCTRRCLEDFDCGATGYCLAGAGVLGEADNICLNRCASDGDCRAGYACISFPTSPTTSVGACWVPPPGGATTYQAVDAGPGANAGIMGGSCSSDVQCQPPADGFCVPGTLSDGGVSRFPGGSCTADCTYGGDPYCGGGAGCVLFIAGASNPETSEVFGLCAGLCTTTASTCRTGYTCQAYFSSTEGVCWPP